MLGQRQDCGILQPVGLCSAGLRIRRRGPHFRRCLAHGTATRRRSVEIPSSRSPNARLDQQSPTGC